MYLLLQVFLFFQLVLASGSPDIETGKYVENFKQNWNFELYNKCTDTIWFSIYFPGWIKKNNFISYEELKSGEKMRIVVKLEENPVIQIWRKEYPLFFGGLREKKPILERQLKPCVGQHAEIIGIQCKRTAFLTFDENNVLRPQTGPMKGFSTTTESGLNRMINITPSGIRPITKPLK